MAKGGRVRTALLAVDLSGPTASSLRLAPTSPASGRTVGSMMVRAWRNRMVPVSRSRSAHSRPQSSPLRAPVAAASTVQGPSHGLGVWAGRRPAAPRPARGPAPRLGTGDRWWGGVGGGVVGEQPPGDRLGQGAVQAAVHGQDVLGGGSARLAVPAAADGEVVVGSLNLKRVELLERPGADGGSDMVAEQRRVPRHGPGAPGGADMGEPAVEVLVDDDLGRVECEAVAAAGQSVG